MFQYLMRQMIDGSSSLSYIYGYNHFRNICALFTSFIIMIGWGDKFIKYLLSTQKNGQPIRKYYTDKHNASKKNTPCMGGVLIIISIIISTLLWSNIVNSYIMLLNFILITFGLIGITDDYKKIRFNKSEGISAKSKFLFQCVLSIIATIIISILSIEDHCTTLTFPLFKNFIIDLNIFYFMFSVFVITGTSNAVNISDGLDSLAIGLIIILSTSFIIVSYLSGYASLANCLKLIHIKNSQEISVFFSAIVGASLGFLWYNIYPAKIFMGDTGSLSLGAVIGTTSVITKSEITLCLIGIVIVFEALSVILQVISFRYTKKRIFIMSPVHHHFEKIGWSEPTIVIRFWIVAIISVLLFVFLLQLRYIL